MRLLVLNLATDADDTILGFTTSWIRALARRVERIFVITMRAGTLSVPGNVSVYSVGKEKNYSRPRRAIEFYRFLNHVLCQGSIDACFSHMTPIFTVLAAPVLWTRRIPIVTWYAHRSVPFTLKLAHFASEVMVTSGASSYRFHRADNRKVRVIGQGIDTRLFSPGTAPDHPPFLLSVGRISPIKDQMSMIEAVHLLRHRGFDVRCIFIGATLERDGAYAHALARRIRALGLDDRVSFLGGIVHERLVDWYRRCFLHVSSSPTGALDKTALEAMSCGRPSLVANDGFRETLLRWADQLIFRQGDVGHLSDKIVALLQDTQDVRQTMCRELRDSVVHRHDLERLVAHLVSLLEEVSKHRRRGHADCAPEPF